MKRGTRSASAESVTKKKPSNGVKMIYHCDICKTELVSMHEGTITCYFCLRSEKGWRETISEEILTMQDIDEEESNPAQVIVYRKDAAQLALVGLDIYQKSHPKELWTCSMCGNKYSTDISKCPNENLETLGDELI